MSRTTLAIGGALAVAVVAGAIWMLVGREPDPDTSVPPRPNVLWIVWDTVRSDRLTPYDSTLETTPKLAEWARGARVYEDVVSVAHSTLPSHASMFTGLTSGQHQTHYSHPRLGDQHDTIAELLKGAGYDTYLWSSNPHVSEQTNLHQGFDTVQHPWDGDRLSEAIEIVRAKVVEDRGTGVAAALEGQVRNWAIKASGELAEPNLIRWLESREGDSPYFAFLNYMEAHRQYIPGRAYRERFMTPAQVERSYTIDQSWLTVWKYVFGLHDYSEEDMAIIRATYDATLAELDDLLASLLDALRERGELENTIVILTADHGEHLGEHHLVDHQFTVFEEVLRVPLIVHYPERFEPGRDDSPVSNGDVFPTLLELAGVEPPDLPSPMVSLLHPAEDRVRLAEHPVPHLPPVNLVRRVVPTLNVSTMAVSMCALYQGGRKLIYREGIDNWVFDVASDPRETRPIENEQIESALVAQLGVFLQRYPALPAEDEPPPPELDEEQREGLRSLGYLDDDPTMLPDPTPPDPTPSPSSSSPEPE